MENRILLIVGILASVFVFTAYKMDFFAVDSAGNSAGQPVYSEYVGDTHLPQRENNDGAGSTDYGKGIQSQGIWRHSTSSYGVKF